MTTVRSFLCLALWACGAASVRAGDPLPVAAEPWYMTPKGRETITAWGKVLNQDSTRKEIERVAIRNLARAHAHRVLGEQYTLNWTSSEKTQDRVKPLYAIPFALLAREQQAAGIRRAAALSGDESSKDDRDPFGSISFGGNLPTDEQQEYVTDVAKFMESCLGAAGDPLPTNGCCYYLGWGKRADGLPNRDPGVCGSVLMGMQSAFNLGFLNPPPPAPDSAAMEKRRARWTDVLVHVILTYSCCGDGKGNYSSENIVAGAAFKRDEFTEPADASRDDTGPLIFLGDDYQRRQTPAPPAPPATNGATARPKLYRRSYIYADRAPPNAYQSASGGYALLTAAQLLARTLSFFENKGVSRSGQQYLLTRNDGPGGAWTCVAQGQTFTISYDMNARYGGVVFDGANITPRPLHVDGIVDEILRGVVADQTTGPLQPLGLGTVSAPDGPYTLFTIGKFYTAAGYPETIGNWPWHLRFCEWLAANKIGDDNDIGDGYMPASFSVLCATQAYQPVYKGANPQ